MKHIDGLFVPSYKEEWNDNIEAIQSAICVKVLDVGGCYMKPCAECIYHVDNLSTFKKAFGDGRLDDELS